MLDLVLVFRIILIAITGFTVFSALMSEDKKKVDWLVITYLVAVLIYVIIR